MAEASQDTHHPEELQSDLSLLVEMVKDAKQDEAVIHRQLESLKTKLDHFVHSETRSRGGSRS